MQADEIPKNQHYVPQFLLRHFSVPLKSSQIFAFDKQKEVSFVTNIKNVCSETGFYNIQVGEMGLSMEGSLSKLESQSANILRRIIDNERLPSPDSHERAVLAIFVATQFLRVKTARTRIDKMNDLLKMKLQSLGTKESDVERLTNLGENESKVISMKMLESLHDFVPFFLFKTWTLLKAPKEMPLLISDNPVTLQNHKDFGLLGNLGLGVEGIQIYMPVSSKLSLGILCPTHEKEFTEAYQRYVNLKSTHPQLSERLGAERESLFQSFIAGMRDGTAINLVSDNVLNLNSLQTAFSHRFVYGNSDSFDVVRQMIHDNPKFKTEPHPELVT